MTRAKPTLSLSTSWCSSRHTDGYAMAQEMAGLGFGHIELSHGIRITLVPGILRAVPGKKVAAGIEMKQLRRVGGFIP